MQPERQHFKLLRSVNKRQADDLSNYLKGLFNEDCLEQDELMRAGEHLEFDVQYIQQGDLCYAAFSVSVSGSPPTDSLFAYMTERFQNADQGIYEIGKPGSGAVAFQKKQ